MARGVVVGLAFCGCSDQAGQVAWPGSVEAEVDNLTSRRTGLVRYDVSRSSSNDPFAPAFRLTRRWKSASR